MHTIAYFAADTIIHTKPIIPTELKKQPRKEQSVLQI